MLGSPTEAPPPNLSISIPTAPHYSQSASFSGLITPVAPPPSVGAGLTTAGSLGSNGLQTPSYFGSFLEALTEEERRARTRQLPDLEGFQSLSKQEKRSSKPKSKSSSNFPGPPPYIRTFAAFNPSQPPESSAASKRKRLAAWETDLATVDSDLLLYKRTVDETRKRLKMVEDERAEMDIRLAAIRSNFLATLSSTRAEIAEIDKRTASTITEACAGSSTKNSKSLKGQQKLASFTDLLQTLTDRGFITSSATTPLATLRAMKKGEATKEPTKPNSKPKPKSKKRQTKKEKEAQVKAEAALALALALEQQNTQQPPSIPNYNPLGIGGVPISSSSSSILGAKEFATPLASGWILPGETVKVNGYSGTWKVKDVMPRVFVKDDKILVNSSANSNSNTNAETNTESTSDNDSDDPLKNNSKKRLSVIPPRIAVQFDFGIGYFPLHEIERAGDAKSVSEYTDKELANRWSAMLKQATENKGYFDVEGMADVTNTNPIFGGYDKSSESGSYRLIKFGSNVVPTPGSRGLDLSTMPLTALYSEFNPSVTNKNFPVLASDANLITPEGYTEWEDERLTIYTLKAEMLQLKNTLRRLQANRLMNEKPCSLAAIGHYNKQVNELDDMRAKLWDIKKKFRAEQQELGISEDKAEKMLKGALNGKRGSEDEVDVIGSAVPHHVTYNIQKKKEAIIKKVRGKDIDDTASRKSKRANAKSVSNENSSNSENSDDENSDDNDDDDNNNNNNNNSPLETEETEPIKPKNKKGGNSKGKAKAKGKKGSRANSPQEVEAPEPKEEEEDEEEANNGDDMEVDDDDDSAKEEEVKKPVLGRRGPVRGGGADKKPAAKKGKKRGR
ncbi:hypothetical protein ScalyP_jg10961 [Parmales sp. scaly parma]|nr:hypothetical protein ScalyP_jg10961 [Parmales sp. scaly parma]